MTRSPDSLVPSASGQPDPEKRDDKALTCRKGGEANWRTASEDAEAQLKSREKDLEIVCRLKQWRHGRSSWTGTAQTMPVALRGRRSSAEARGQWILRSRKVAGPPPACRPIRFRAAGSRRVPAQPAVGYPPRDAEVRGLDPPVRRTCPPHRNGSPSQRTVGGCPAEPAQRVMPARPT
jgi:hypothetical protein